MSKVLGKSIVAGPGVGCTQTFITVGAFDTELEAINCQKYINTKFARCMLSIKKVTQHNSAKAWECVPLQDFTEKSDIDWSKSLPNIDWQLYRKYSLTLGEIKFIEEHIEYRDDLPEEWLPGTAVYAVVVGREENKK